jgi:hypothetical protein
VAHFERVLVPVQPRVAANKHERAKGRRQVHAPRGGTLLWAGHHFCVRVCVCGGFMNLF